MLNPTTEDQQDEKPAMGGTPMRRIREWARRGAAVGVIGCFVYLACWSLWAFRGSSDFVRGTWLEYVALLTLIIGLPLGSVLGLIVGFVVKSGEERRGRPFSPSEEKRAALLTVICAAVLALTRFGSADPVMIAIIWLGPTVVGLATAGAVPVPVRRGTPPNASFSSARDEANESREPAE